MPGTQSALERHEWIKHGTCTKMSADDYFATAIHLMGDLNASAVRDLFAANVGKTLKADAIKAAFDKSFGAGASDRVKMSCRRVGRQARDQRADDRAFAGCRFGSSEGEGPRWPHPGGRADFLRL